jgi:tetrahydromethanopterin S-methyltransferase subunit F
VSLSSGTVAPGGSLDVTVSDAPAGATVPIDLHSDPVRLTVATADASGTATVTVVIPADTAVGVHQIVATVNGVEYTAQLTVEQQLAATGVTSATLPMTAIGGALLLAGAGALVLGRPRYRGRHTR